MRDSMPELGLFDERRTFLNTIKQMGGNSILTRIHNDGHQEALYISPEYLAMMHESSEDDAMRYNASKDFSEVIYPEDRPLVEYMLAHHEAPDKSHNLQIRKITAKQNIIWCDIHYAFISLKEESYLYMTFYDITLFRRENQNQLRLHRPDVLSSG